MARENNINNTRDKFQKFGSFLSGMVIPNIGAFIAFGLITAIFIDSGWAPNKKIAELITPLLNYLLPILIGYSGGGLVHGKRGAVAGAIGTFGIVVGADIPMFLGAMIIGPFSGLIIKKFDDLIKDKVPNGFEMIVDNFSLGILGGIICVLSFLFIEPVVVSVTNAMAGGIEFLMNKGFLPLVSLLIEPGRVLFLNNAIDHGIMAPLGLTQVAKVGYSPLFMIIGNPGIGLGILLAYWKFGKGNMKEAAPGAMIIQFLGGIHEIYFPYVLSNPLTLIACIAGQATNIIVMQLLHYGTVYTPSPASIFSVIAMTPKGKYLAMLIVVLSATIVTFLVASIFVKRYYKNYTGDEEETNENLNENIGNEISSKEIEKIVVACDAGMGSSAMTASSLKKRLKNEGFDLDVIHTSIQSIPDDADLIVVHKELAEAAKKKAPNKTRIIISSYINPKEFDDVVKLLNEKRSDLKTSLEVLPNDNIIIDNSVTTKEDALIKINQKFVEGGYTTEKYLDGMKEKESEFHTNMGNGLAIPHGSYDYKSEILNTGLVVIVNKNGITWNDEKVYLVIGIAGKGDEHLEILSKIATEFDTEEKVKEIVELADKEKIKKALE